MLTATRLWNGWHSYAMESNDPEVIAFAQSQNKNNKDGITNAVPPPEYLMHVDLPIRAKGSGCF
jgi:hypothetical protein